MIKYLVSFLIVLAFSMSLPAQNKETVHERDLQEVVVSKKTAKYRSKKENPAYAIMQEVWKNRRNNGLDKFNTYSFREYEKIQFDLANIDSAFTKKKVFKNLDFIFDYADSTGNGRIRVPMFLNEAVYENFGMNSPAKKTKRTMVAQKSSGFQDNEIVALTAKNLYRNINIYDNIINYFDIGFQSPVSRDGFSVYDYEVVDTVSVRGQDSYQIRYTPKRKDVLALQGYLYISTAQFAVTKASLRSTSKMSVNYVNNIFTEIDFENPDAETFLPVKIRTEIGLSPFSKKKDDKSLIATRTVSYDSYQFNPALAEDLFVEKESEMQKDFTKKDDAYWSSVRGDSLSGEEQKIYEMAARLEQASKFRHITKIYETAASGYYNVGKAIDLGDIYSIYGYNEVEGSRIRVGARTYFSQNDDWRIQGYTAYGFRDNQFKYGLEGKYMFNKVNRLTVGAGTRRDIMQLGVQLTTDDGIMTRSFASSSVFGRGTNASLSHVNQTNIFASVEPWKNFTVRLDGTLQSIRSANEQMFNLYYHDKSGNLRKTVNDSHVTMSLIARPGAKCSQTGVDRYEHSTLAPTIILKYTRGLEGLFNADFGYDKLQLLFYKPMLIGSWGKSFVKAEAGKNFSTVPLALQNVIPGNQSYSLVSGTFSQLNYYEFVADSYATGHWEHHFNGKLLSFVPLIKKLKLREVAFIRGAYGMLSEASRSINVEGHRYSAPDRNIYYEYGFGIENIGLGNLRIFRIDFNWRGNYLDRPDVQRFGIKAGFQFFY